MSDEKSRLNLGIMPTKRDGIPVPATTAPPRNSRKRIFKFILSLLLFYVVLDSVHSLVRRHRFQVDLQKGPFGKPLMGKAAEKYFLEVPNEESCIQASRRYTAEPHRAGSEGDFSTATQFLTLVQTELGIKPPSELPIYPAGSVSSRHATTMIPKAPIPYAWIDTYYPVMNTPLDRNLQALDEDGNVMWEADLKEHADAADPEAHKYSDAVPTFHGLSKGADVSGKLVYANYGLIEDYNALVEQGVNFTGAIVLARYGGNFRGIKVQLAQELGAAGVLIYSDVRDDGVIPQHQDVPAYENATRTEGVNKPKIPSLPISQENGEKLLELAKGDWNGTVRLNNQVDEKVMPIWNTMAIIPGYIKDEVVMIGNHRDGKLWALLTLLLATASLHETIRGFGALMKKGWKPLRTILIASWDAEEYGLIGSTEWGEDFADFIDKYCFRFASLAHLVHDAAVDLPHPTETNKTLWDATKDTGKFFGTREDLVMWDAEAASLYKASMSAQDELGVGVLGSGSDYTIFLQRIGVASMNHGFGSTQSDAVYHYHSVYDSERWEEMYADPGFYRHVAVAKHLGLIALRLAGSAVLPLNTTHYSYELENYLNKVEGLVLAESIEVDLSPLRKSIHSLQAASRALDFEKLIAERELKKILKKWHKKGSKLRKLRRKARKAWCKIQKKVFDKECHSHHHSEEQHQRMDREEERSRISPRSENGIVPHDRHAHPRKDSKIQTIDVPTWHREQEERFEILRGFALHSDMQLPASLAHGDHACDKSTDRPHFPLPKIFKAIKRIRAVNQKLVAFERGFISEDGLPGREWYKHLGVAPGRWLVVNGTLMYSMIESLTLDKNSTLAKYEAKRLEKLVDKLVETIRV
ncbi:Zn-dependent exopeptidase [Gymnopus androsaceus JB14]|uniref:Zn-dependent exopeptidase n=1 Tax=Gymnopus androsaceus JB14 TaxID=1447944 RepID=A0A6A4HL47_9AGAR|nr:Zn-dependent exopeptidase [Gymnopus androsaceus JB14]